MVDGLNMGYLQNAIFDGRNVHAVVQRCQVAACGIRAEAQMAGKRVIVLAKKHILYPSFGHSM